MRLDEWEPIFAVGKFEGSVRCDLSNAEPGDEDLVTCDTWLWCLHCYRMQQVETVRFARNGAVLCSFAGCEAGLIGMDLWPCDDGQHEGMFPSIADRKSGQVIPLR